MPSHLQVPNPTLPYLLSILKLSDFWLIRDGIRFVVDALPQHPQFDAPLKLHLALTYRITDWIEPSYRALLQKRYSQISQADAIRLGIEVYFIVMQTKHLIDEIAQAIAFHPPAPFHSWLTHDKKKCSQAWADGWWGGFARHILHPDKGVRGMEAWRALEDAHIPGFDLLCKLKTMEEMGKTKAPFVRMETIITDGLEKLRAICGTLPNWALRPESEDE